MEPCLWTPPKKRIRRPTLVATTQCAPWVGRQDASGGGFFDMQPPILPTDINGLSLWLRADLGVTIATGVSYWRDQSGVGDINRNFQQAGGSAQPTYNATDAAFNSKPTLSFLASSLQDLQSVGAFSPTLPGPYTIFIVMSEDAVLTNNYIVMGEQAATIYYLQANSGANDYFINGNAQLFSQKPRQTTPFIWAAEYNTTSSSIRLNDKGPETLGSTGATNVTMTRPTLGSYTAGGGFSLNGKIAEVIVYGNILSAANMSNVLNYLSNRYAIALVN